MERLDDTTQSDSPVALLVGLSGDVPLTGGWRRVHATFGAVSPYLLAQVRPDCVACPLLGTDFDAATLAQRLARIGFAGRLIVVAPALPDSRMVAREIAAAAPGIEVDILPEG